jgi:hypothetical protein
MKTRVNRAHVDVSGVNIWVVVLRESDRAHSDADLWLRELRLYRIEYVCTAALGRQSIQISSWCPQQQFAKPRKPRECHHAQYIRLRADMTCGESAADAAHFKTAAQPPNP